VKLSRVPQIVAGVAITAAGLAFFFRDVDTEKLLEALGSVPLWSVLASVVLAVTTLWVRSYRWRFLLPDTPGTTKSGLFPITMVGFMVNNVLPARAGEAARALLLWRNNKFSVAACLGSLVVERIIDSATLLTLYGISVFGLDALSDSRQIRQSGYIVFVIVAGVCLGFVLYAFFSNTVAAWGRALTNRAPEKYRPRVRSVGAELASALQWVHRPRRVAVVVLLSAPIMLIYSLIMLLLSRGLGGLGFMGSLFAQAFAAFGAAIPLAPGYIGTTHALVLYAAKAVGMPADSGRALAILYHVVNYVPVTAVGLYYFFRLKVNFRRITRAKEELHGKED